MWRRLRRRGSEHGGVAVAEPPVYEGSNAELAAEIGALTDREPATDRRVLELRHVAGIRALDGAAPGPALHVTAPGRDRGITAPDPVFAAPDEATLPPERLPALAARDLTRGLLRAAILRDGCALVRGLVDPGAAAAFAAGIDRAFAERERGEDAAPGWYEPFDVHPRFQAIDNRDWIKAGGGVLAVDSPRLTLDMLELFAAAGVPALVDGYLGEPGLLSAQKTTLRKAEPSVPGAWHQDGAFMDEVRALNLWLALSRCGDVAPGLDLVPCRLDHIVATGTDEAVLSFQVSQRMAEEAAGDVAIERPVFEPGDALFFDELFLHQTASDPAMPHPRFAIESWFFGASAFPGEWAPLTVQ